MSSAEADDKWWVVLRRVHFYISDLVVAATRPHRVGVIERRLLDALDYVEKSGAGGGVSVATICAIIQAPTKYQTAVSALDRMQGHGWVMSFERADSEERSRRSNLLWQLTPSGRNVRETYGKITESIMKSVYAEAEVSRRERLFQHGELAVEYMNERVGAILDVSEGPTTGDFDPKMWAALRRTHFYINDLIFREIEPVGVGLVERRVLDAISFARKHGAVDGIDVATMCRLNEALSRQNAISALERMANRQWVARAENGSASQGRVPWRLIEKGDKVRKNYKRYTEYKLREVYETGHEHTAEPTDMLELAQSAQAYRNERLVPVVEQYLHATAKVRP